VSAPRAAAPDIDSRASEAVAATPSCLPRFLTWAAPRRMQAARALHAASVRPAACRRSRQDMVRRIFAPLGLCPGANAYRARHDAMRPLTARVRHAARPSVITCSRRLPTMTVRGASSGGTAGCTRAAAGGSRPTASGWRRVLRRHAAVQDRSRLLALTIEHAFPAALRRQALSDGAYALA
jgi:hypothetical protein